MGDETPKKTRGRKRQNLFRDCAPPDVTFPHTCTQLHDVVAHNHAELEALFGWRNMGTTASGEVCYRPQSWSRQARAEAKRRAPKQKVPHDPNGDPVADPGAHREP